MTMAFNPQLRQFQSAFTASVVTLDDLLQTPGVVQAGNEIQIPDNSVIQIGGILTLPVGDYILLGDSTSLVGTTPELARIIGTVSGAAVVRITNAVAISEIANLTISNTSTAIDSAAVLYEGGGNSGYPYRTVNNCILLGVKGVQIESGAVAVRNTRAVTSAPSNYGTGSGGVVVVGSVQDVTISDCEFVNGAFSFGVVTNGATNNLTINDNAFYGIDGTTGTLSAGIRQISGPSTRTTITNNRFYQAAASDNNSAILSSLTYSLSRISGNTSFLTGTTPSDPDSAVFLRCTSLVNCRVLDNASQGHLYRVSGSTSSDSYLSGEAAEVGLIANSAWTRCSFSLASKNSYALSLTDAVSDSNITDCRGSLGVIRFDSTSAIISTSQISDCSSPNNILYYDVSLGTALINGATLVSDCRAESVFINGVATFPAWSALGFPAVGSRNNCQNGSLAGSDYPLSFP